MEQKVKNLRIKIDDYFGTDDKETAIWFFCGLGFPIACGAIVFIVSVVI
ncbi:hypothetical protein [Carnobacterium maltaromaticum]|nr:hypothetical protein [Carnobacterium maltaromaticum]